MNEPLAYAVDFGTSNSAMAVAYADRVEVLPIEPSGSLPQSLASIVYLDRTKQRSSGEEAVRQFLVTGTQSTRCSGCDFVGICNTYVQGGFCMDTRLMTGLKSHMADEWRTTHSWGVDFSVADRIAVILRAMKQRADRLTGRDVRRAVLGHPVAFEGTEGPRFAELQKLAQETLVEAAKMAGFEEVVLFPEPSAAVIDEPLEQGRALAVDFGGGTFDVAIIDFRPDSAQVTALQGASIGGERFDAMLFDRKVAPQLGINDRYPIGLASPQRFPKQFADQLRTLGGTARLLSDRKAARLLKQFLDAPGGGKLRPVWALLYGGQAYELYKSIERAKIELSESPVSYIRMDRPGIKLNLKVTEEEFAGLIAEDMKVVRGAIERAMHQAGVGVEDIDVVIRTGGSSRITAFRQMLESMFGPEKVQERHIFNTVVAGLGTEARRVWAA